MKKTDDLQSDLMNAPDIGRFLAENTDCFRSADFSTYLQQLFDKKGISKAALARSAVMSEVYLYQLFSGGRRPSRNRVLCLCFGLSATLEETQQLLKDSGNAPLYVRDRRDAIVLHGIGNGLSLDQVNDTLYREGERTLY